MLRGVANKVMGTVGSAVVQEVLFEVAGDEEGGFIFPCFSRPLFISASFAKGRENENA